MQEIPEVGSEEAKLGAIGEEDDISSERSRVEGEEVVTSARRQCTQKPNDEDQEAMQPSLNVGKHM